MIRTRTNRYLWTAILASLATQASAVDDDGERYIQIAKKVVTATATRGGLVIHLDCGDGKLTAALGVHDGFLVCGLARNEGDARAARAHVRLLGRYGPVIVERWSGTHLPFVDNLAGLVVGEEADAALKDEILRVLRPGGTAYLRSGDTWQRFDKPRPEQIDEWTHFLHDASGNAVARDSAVGPPRRMQWVAGPRWSRNHHRLASVSSVVSADGRLFYIVDDATAGSIHVPGRWSLVARDAFSGVQLWKRPIPSWAWEQRRFRSGPVQLPRLLVATGDRVFIPLGLSEPVAELDAATGEIVRTFEQTRGAEEMVVAEGVLLVVTGSEAAEQAMVRARRRGEKFEPSTKSVVAVRIADGEPIWTWSDGPSTRLMPLTLAADADRVVFQAGEGVRCHDLEGGGLLWNVRAPVVPNATDPKKDERPKQGRSAGWSTATLVLYEDTVLWAHAGRLRALSVADGAVRWESPCDEGFKSPIDVLVAGGLVWVGPQYNVGRNVRTGEIERQLLDLGDLRTAGHHHRCYRQKATDRYIIGGYRGMEFLALSDTNHSRNNWVRGTCQYGILPCNGLVYTPPHACGCYMEAKLYGFWALAPEPATSPEAIASPRLERGPAFAGVASTVAGGEATGPDDWPTYRGDARRSGATTSAVGPALAMSWQTTIGGSITPPVVAGSTVLVSAIDAHRIVALGARDGAERWSFIAGGRVDSPPTIHGNLVLFGSADGHVYCLRLADGELVWRFRAAPHDRRTVAFDRLESIWPVHGSVLVANGLAYVTAGRSSYLDGGIRMYALDPATGAVRHETRIRSEHPAGDEGARGTAQMTATLTQNATDPKTFQAPDRSDAFSMAGGTTTDVLVGDGASVFLRSLRFDARCVRQAQRAPHLFSTSQLLDGSENHRSHWVLGGGDFSRIPVAYSWIANRRGGAYGSRVVVPYGLMLAFDDEPTWGIRRVDGYTLFAEARRPDAKAAADLPDLRSAEKADAPKWRWSTKLDLRPRAMVRAGSVVLVAGMPAVASKTSTPQLLAQFEGRATGALHVFSATDGASLARHELAAPPAWDGMAVARGRVYTSGTNGTVTCLAEPHAGARAR